MRDVGRALVAGLSAPARRPRLALLLWLSRLVPILLFFTLPFLAASSADLARQPQARALLDAPSDATGFSWAWTNDFFASKFDAAERVFWLALFSWLLVSVLAGGFVAALLGGPAEPFLAACGRYAGRFLRLAAAAAVLLYLADAGVNALLAERHAAEARLHHTQDFAVGRAVARGALFLALAFLVGAVHSYARIDLVANDRRSALGAIARGFGILFARLPKLLLVEAGMLLASGAAALVAFVLLRASRPGVTAGWPSFALFLAAAALGSYLRTALELGTLEARCRLLVPPAPPPSPLESALASPPAAPPA